MTFEVLVPLMFGGGLILGLKDYLLYRTLKNGENNKIIANFIVNMKDD